ncbi:MAG: hypothetical protein MK081_10120 [Flavobacteriales bacterium]|nr:hypothetical protein [Flavobacteriales bacterium]
MKLFITMLILAFPILEGSGAFEKAMKKGMRDLASAESVEELTDLAADFGKIADANPEQWQPVYYQAFCLVSASFDATTTEKLTLLGKADPIVSQLVNDQLENSEVWALKGLYHSAQLMAEMNKAPQISPMIQAAAGRSIEIDAANPRAQFLLISNKMGKAAYFGQDVASYCAEAQEALKNFDAYDSGFEFGPTWGKEQLRGLTKSCER